MSSDTSINDIYNQINFSATPSSSTSTTGNGFSTDADLNTILSQDFTNTGSVPPSAAFNLFLQQFNPSNPSPSPIPTNLKDFLDKWTAFAKTSFGYNPTTQPENSALLQAFVKVFAESIGVQIDPNSLTWTNNGDWSILINDPSLNISTTIDLNNPNDPFDQALNKFLSDPSKDFISGSSLTNSAQFLTQYNKFMSSTAMLQLPGQAYLDPSLPADYYDSLPTYEGIFKAFGPPDPTGELFKARLAQFYTDTVNSQGSFLPNQAFGDWVKEIVNENNPLALNPLRGGSLDGNNSEKALILNRILQLLIKVITSLQNVGIAQSNRLQFLTNFQQAYTNLQTQIPVFLREGTFQGKLTPLNFSRGTDATAAAQARNDINSSFNGQLADSLRAFRGIQEDNAKQLQTNINSTNDAVNQQTDMVTSFLQQLSTLLSTILR